MIHAESFTSIREKVSVLSTDLDVFEQKVRIMGRKINSKSSRVSFKDNLLEWDGVTMSRVDWADHLKVSYANFCNRYVKYGLSERTFTAGHIKASKTDEHKKATRVIKQLKKKGFRASFIAATLNDSGLRSATGKKYTEAIVNRVYARNK